MRRLKDPAITRFSHLQAPVSVPIDPGLLVAGLLALFAIAPLLAYAGLPNTADGPAHLMRQAELNQAWRDGLLYPRWAPDLAYGYGMPLFHYAPPLLYQVTQLIHLTGLPLDASMKGTLILAMLLYSLGMYLFARDRFGPRAGLLAAAVYLYAPYRLREAYIQGNYGQFLGLAFYPLILWAFHGLIVVRRWRYLPLAALALAGLLLSHNISAMLFAPLLVAYGVFLVGGRETGSPDSPISNLLLPALALALGLGLSAFFWLPAFGERDMIRLAGITTGFFDFRYNFISLGELLALPRPLDLSAINPYFPLSLGLAQITFSALALLGLGAYGLRRIAYYVLRTTRSPRGTRSTLYAPRSTLHVLFFAAALLVYACLALPQSQAVWEVLPLLELAEFPWRMLGPALLCAATLAGATLSMAEEWIAGRGSRAAGPWLLGIGLGFTIAVNLFYLFPAQFIAWGTPGPAQVVAYEAQSGAIGTTSTGEFLPRWADRFPSPETLGPDYAAGRPPTKLDPAGLPPGASATTLTHTARETRVAVSSPAPFTATFRALYWPGWRALLAADATGQAARPIALQITRPEGLIRANLPAGEYYVKLELASTPIRRAATALSLLSLVAWLGLITGRLLRSTATSSTPLPSPKHLSSGASRLPRLQALVTGSALVVAVLLTRPLAGWFRVQSPPDSVYGARYALRADYGDQVRLLAYDLPAGQPISEPGPSLGSSPDLPRLQVRAGSRLPIVLYWRALVPLEADYSVFVHLDAPDGQTYAGADELNPEDIPTSGWPPALYVRNPLTLALPADLPPIRYTLTAGLYDPEEGMRLALTDCAGCPRAGESGDALPLADIWVLPATPPDERAIPGRLDARLGAEIRLLGYELTSSDPAVLTLYWRAEAAPQGRSDQRPYTVFIHARGGGGELLAQFDMPPLNGLYATSDWLPGQIIADPHQLALPDATQTLAVGLYDPVSLARLPVRDAQGQRMAEDAVVLPVRGGRD